jgi:hypothetical protein
VTVLEGAAPDPEAVHEAVQAMECVVVAAVAQLPGLQHVAGLVRHAEEEEPVRPHGVVEEVLPEVGVLRRVLEEVRQYVVGVLPPEVEVVRRVEVVPEVPGRHAVRGRPHDGEVLVQMLVLQVLV